MKIPIFKVSVFTATLLLGIALSFAWYFSFCCSSQFRKINSVQSFAENQESKLYDKPIEPEISRIYECESKNPMTFPSSDWKGKGIISGGVLNQWIICGSLPKYPEKARIEEVSDVVIVEIIVDEIGEVKKAQAKYGNHLFFKSAVAAAYKTRFAPRLLGGEVYKVKGILMYKFDADNGTYLLNPNSPDNPFKKR